MRGVHLCERGGNDGLTSNDAPAYVITVTYFSVLGDSTPYELLLSVLML